MNEAIAIGIALATIGSVLWYLRQRQKAPEAKRLKDWLAYIEAGGVLDETAYAAIDALFPPGLKAKYLKASAKLRNDYSARALTIELILRDQAAGVPISSRQLEILQKEGLLGTKAESKTPVPVPEEGEEGK